MSQGNSKQPASKGKYKKAINIACGVVAMSAAIVFVMASVFALLSSDPDVAENNQQPDASGGSSSATAKKKVITGLVTMADTKKPVAGAQVRLLTKPEGEEHATTQVAITDAKGVFIFDEIGEGNTRVMGYYKEYASRAKRYQGQGVWPNKQNLVVPLFKVPSIKVRVISSKTKQPISGATVQNVWTDAEKNYQTDENGEVVIHGLTPEMWTIQVNQPSYASQTKEITLKGTGTTDLLFEVEQGAVLMGEVVDEQGAGISGVSIDLIRDRIKHVGSIKSDANGKFIFPYVPISDLNVHCYKDGFIESQEKVSITTKPGSQQKLKLTLEKRPYGGFVRGIVTDADGQVIVGAEITNKGRSSRDIRKAISDNYGAFQLDDVFEGGALGHELIVKAKGFAPKVVKFNPGKRESSADLKIILEQGHSIQGLVVDEAGVGIPEVFISYPGRALPGLSGRTKTDQQGKFSIDSLPAKCTFHMSKAGYSSIESNTLELDSNQVVKVTMLSPGMIRGRVVDSITGKTVSPFVVKVTFSPDRMPDDPRGGLSSSVVTRDGQKFSKKDGKFQIGKFMRNMALQVTVLADGYHQRVERRVVAEGAAEATVIEYQLTPIDESTLLSFSGQLVNKKAEPIAGAELRLIVANGRSNDQMRSPLRWEMLPYRWYEIQRDQIQRMAEVKQFLSVVSDENGKFQFDRVFPSKHIDLAYWGDGVSQGQLSQLENMTEHERSEIKLIIVTPGRLVGKIDREIYPTVKMITLYGSGYQTSFNNSIASSENSFDLPNIPPGEYQLRLDAYERDSENSMIFRTRSVKELTVEIKSGETLELDLGFESNKPAS
ncbi:MAG: hypothetical protein COA78_04330 [Blastopirellula sp.]|nr:MAG: hypothetical protein COA78_04330 [Blastopirellula sp.]